MSFSDDKQLELIAHMNDAERMLQLGQPVSPTTVRGLLAGLRDQERATQ